MRSVDELNRAEVEQLLDRCERNMSLSALIAKSPLVDDDGVLAANYSMLLHIVQLYPEYRDRVHAIAAHFGAAGH